MASPRSVAFATGTDFLSAGSINGNLRRVGSSSEETAVASEDRGSVMQKNRASLNLPHQYTVVPYNGEVRDCIKRSPPAVDFPPFVTQVIDTGTFLALLIYLGTLTYLACSASVVSHSPIFPILFVAAKLLNYAGQFIDHVWRFVSSCAYKHPVTPLLRIQGNVVPKVDIIITTYNELVENVIDTVAAAAVVDYPKDRFRVFVSDDGNDADLKRQVEELASSNPNIHYFSRDKTNRPNGSKYHGSKAGNVNDCIHHVKQIDMEAGNNPAAFFVCLDADMIPSRPILRSLVAHTVSDKKVAMVTLPQHFYNLPPNDPIHQNMLVHGEADEVLRNRLQAAWCPGSGFLIRAATLAQLGGFPETSIAEDVLFSWILQGQGWKTVYVNEKLQWGLQPNSLASHIGQRTKWCVGHINNSCELGFCLTNPRTEGMNTMQRAAAIGYCFKPWTTVGKFFSWVFLGICLWSGQPFIAGNSPDEIRLALIAHFLFWLFTRMNEVSLSRVYGYWTMRRQVEFNIWISPHLTWAIIRERVLPNWLGGHKLGFTSTGSMRAKVDERNGDTRGNVITRLWRMNLDTGLLILVAFYCFMVYWIVRNISNSENRTDLLTTALFPGFGFEQMHSFLVLLAYAVNPPTDPPRRSLMQQDEDGIWYPTPAACGGSWTAWIYLLELPQVVVSLWAFAAIFLFV